MANNKDGTLLYWFRYDLRLHDMPSLSEALQSCSKLYPIYIFDEEDILFRRIGYNKLRFILDALKDIDEKLMKINGRLYVFCGEPTAIISDLVKKWNVTHFSYEHDVQPTWQRIESSLHEICNENNINIVSRVSHTLWKTEDILKANGGTPPLIYDIFCNVAECLGSPPRPEPDVNLENVVIPLVEIPNSNLPSCPEEMGIKMECEEQKNKVWIGGETHALQHLKERLQIEEDAYLAGYCMPNQIQPDLLGPAMSMSAALSLGCLSVRRFYWSIRDLYNTINSEEFISDGLVGQLIWREYFYAMCMNNPNFGKMEDNPICLNISWAKNEELLECWTEGKTGFPFIDAVMRQLRQEGWVHHVARNAVACFLTRGELWLSWEEGLKLFFCCCNLQSLGIQSVECPYRYIDVLWTFRGYLFDAMDLYSKRLQISDKGRIEPQVFMKYLLDADFPVCAGNWMWVSSSAFENILQCSTCISPINYGRRFEPSGQYIRKYVPELKDMPQKFLFQPWLAPASVQESAGCIIGKDYPRPIVDHQVARGRNSDKMTSVREKFLSEAIHFHCAPSNPDETRLFMCLPEKCMQNLSCQLSHG